MSTSPSIPQSPPPGKDPPPTVSLTTSPPTASTSPNLQPPPPSFSAYQNRKLSFSKSISRPSRPTLSTQYSSNPLLQSTPQPEEPAPRPPFSPFFTLINDSTTQSTHHPSRIHYIFSDDDESELLTAACVRSLQDEARGSESPGASADLGRSESGASEEQNLGTGSTTSGSSATFRKDEKREKTEGKPKDMREERVIVVDVNETGDGILSANSLSSHWQIVAANLDNAPTFDGADSAGERGDGGKGLMLRIEGVGIGGAEGESMGDSGDKPQGKGFSDSGVMGEEEMQSLLEGFDQKMGMLRKIVAAGENWAGYKQDVEERG